jgi:hypothetical protein
MIKLIFSFAQSYSTFFFLVKSYYLILSLFILTTQLLLWDNIILF